MFFQSHFVFVGRPRGVYRKLTYRLPVARFQFDKSVFSGYNLFLFYSREESFSYYFLKKWGKMTSRCFIRRLYPIPVYSDIGIDWERDRPNTGTLRCGYIVDSFSPRSSSSPPPPRKFEFRLSAVHRRRPHPPLLNRQFRPRRRVRLSPSFRLRNGTAELAFFLMPANTRLVYPQYSPLRSAALPLRLARYNKIFFALARFRS